LRCHITGKANAAAFRTGIGIIFYVAGSKGPCSKNIHSILYSLTRAGNHTSFEVGISPDIDLKAIIASLNPALLVHAGVVTLDATLAVADAAGDTRTN